MKKILFTTLLLAALILPVFSFAAGTVTQTLTAQEPAGISTGGQVQLLEFAFIGSADDGTVPSTATSTAITAAIEGMCIYEVITNPGDGAAAPTTLYDIVLNDADGIDLMGGTLANRSATASERAVPLLMTTTLGTEIAGCAMVNGAMTPVVTNQAVHSATWTVKVFLKRP